ncbi:type VI secretion system protein TssA [Ideonella sp. A 288]|uniref:type VI secretion system protein TssA n=1 Tax=Ideonella sp. A 288 TaxID=1962181 RepID=UPI000B4B2408|nr:type VI secretion system protein TssA [Ideonella sp. A 288]
MLDTESLLVPLSDDAPSGSDLEYDPVFLQLEQAGAGKPEQQFGDKVIPAEAPDWRTVREHALDLASRTRDLRVAVWLARSGARLEGVSGAVGGLKLLHGLLSRRWADVHPQLDESDGNDPTMRVNALAPLAATNAFLADLRSAALTSTRGSIVVRDIELGLGLAEAAGDESVPSEAGVLDALRQALGQDTTLAGMLQGAIEAAKGISQILEEQLVPGTGPDLAPLLSLTRALDQARQRATGADDASAAGAGASANAATGGTSAPGSINSRDDVIRTIDRLCEWIERNEPSNPAPLLLRRSQRLMSMSFLDIVRDLMPEGVDQIERLAGTDGRSS